MSKCCTYVTLCYKGHLVALATQIWHKSSLMLQGQPALTRTTRVSRYQKKHSPTHMYHGHQSSLICFVHLIRSTASSLFSPHAWQSFSTISLQVFFGLSLGLAPSTSYSIHFFTQSLSSFRNTCPYHHSLFCCSTEIMSLPAEVPPHFPFSWAKSHFHATYYFAHNCCTISLSLSMIASLLESSGTNCLNLFHPIQILFSTSASASPSSLSISPK